MLVFWPNGINKCRMELWWFGPDWGEGERPADWDNTIAFFNVVLEEDTEFGKWIQKSQESYGFKSVPLSYQEARIYHWNQWADRLIGIDRIPPELRVPQVIGDEWLYPNDPRLEVAASLMAAE
jgi:phenylpropionate dioxygenase-like ring-hydroxylating dioxygenase large terminal subunit